MATIQTEFLISKYELEIFLSSHHTMSAPLMYAFREALAQIVEEGLDLYKLRHVENAHKLREGLQNIGLELFVENPEQRLPSITSIRIPHGIKIENVIKCMLDRFVCILLTAFYFNFNSANRILIE